MLSPLPNRLTRINVIARLALGAVVVCAWSLPPTASAVGPQSLVAPANGTVLPLGVPPAFVLKDGRDDITTLEVSERRQTDANGIFTDSVWSAGYESRPSGGDITVSPKRSSSRDGFWNKPGTYYWHVDRADCPYEGPRPHTCTQRVVTPTRSFTISDHALALRVATHRSLRVGDPLRVRIGCSHRCRVTFTVLARGRRLFDAANRSVVAAGTTSYRFTPSRWRQTLERSLGARRSLRLTIRVTAHGRDGQRATQSSGTTLLRERP